MTMKEAAAPATPDSQPWPKPAYAWYVVGVLVLAYTSSFVDRQILSLLVEPIREDLNISDTQFSLLAGFAFALFYSVMGLPIAHLSDHHSRRTIIGAGIVMWSIMTVMCGLARNFWGLFAARVGVGVGEAALSPAALSLISDYFPKEQRGKAMAVYATGVYFGSGLALIIGGVVIQIVEQAGPTQIPLIGSVAPWQLTFFYVGFPGLLIAALMWTVREPLRRGMQASTEGGQTDGATFSDLFKFIGERAWTIAFVFSGFSLLGMVVIAYLVWTPALFMRVHGWEASEIGVVFGFIVLIFGTGGILAGGWLSDELSKRGHDDAVLKAALFGGIPAIPLAIFAPLMPTATLSLVALAGAMFCLTSTQALPVVALQLITPNRMRARMSALYFLVGSLLIFSLGPTSVALITDFVFAEDTAINYSLAIICGLLVPTGVVIAYASLGHYRQCVVAAREWE